MASESNSKDAVVVVATNSSKAMLVDSVICLEAMVLLLLIVRLLAWLCLALLCCSLLRSLTPLQYAMFVILDSYAL